MVKKWAQKVHPKKGALHKQLGIPPEKKIPKLLLRKVMEAEVGSKVHGKTVTALMKKRVNFVLNVAPKRRH